MSDLKFLPIDSILFSETNSMQREEWELNNDALKELADSIKLRDVIQPILVRPFLDGKYLLVCGERRLRASSLAGKDSIPAFIKEMTDEEAFENQMTENIQRENPHPLREAICYHALITSNPEKYSVEEMSKMFCKSTSYISMRLSLNKLIPELKKEFSNGDMLLGHAIAFSRLQEADQRECMVKCKIKFGISEGQYEPVKAVEAYIEQHIVRRISKASFNPNDKDLYAEAGSCNTCIKRSGTGNFLFADVTEKDRCFDGACFQAKTSIHMINYIGQLRENNPNLAVIAQQGAHLDSTIKKYLVKNGIKVLKPFADFKEAVASDKQAIQALVVAGADMGELVKIRLVEPERQVNNVTSAKGTAAKNTVEHYDELIQVEKQRFTAYKKDLEGSVHTKMVERALDMKPFVEPDKTPLTPADWTLMLIYIHSVICSSELAKDITGIIKKIPVKEGLKPAQKLAEQWKKAPDEVKNVLIRQVIQELSITDGQTTAGILFQEAVWSWKGLDTKKIEEEVKAAIDAEKTKSEQIIEDLTAKKESLKAKKSKREK